MLAQEEDDLSSVSETRGHVHGDKRLTKSNMPGERVIISGRLTGVVFADPVPDKRDSPPHDMEAARHIRGTCLLDPTALMVASGQQKTVLSQRLILARQHYNIVMLPDYDTVML